MHALQVAARFAAYTWYIQTKTEAKQAEATRFARTHWADFLPAAHEGLGRLLLKIAIPSKRRKSIRMQKRATLACYFGDV